MDIPHFDDPEHAHLAGMIGTVVDKIDEINGENAKNTKFRVQAQAILAVVTALALAWGGTALALLAR